MEPSVVRTVAQLDDALMPSRLASSPVAYVPTLGALHDGHASLMRVARRLGDVVVASIFVNPTQFGPGEDLQKYPRSLDADLDMCSRENVDIVYVPAVETVYPEGTQGITIDPGPAGDLLEGQRRPQHFRGVLTVVAKLFAMVRPSHAVFGEKDYQQLVLVRAMVHDLCVATDIVGVPTVREPDGLALSSRNRFLDPVQRLAATALASALFAGQSAGSAGAEGVMSAARAVLEASAGVEVDYLALTAPDLSEPVEHGPARLLGAVRVGTTRLIDNVSVSLGIDSP
ncbi:MAG: pantoate--beta-alanine ligase [Nocardioidaceae bacterium]